MTTLNFIYKIIFWLALIFIIAVIFSFTIGQMLPLEFSNYKVKDNYYNFAFTTLPFAILLTLVGTIKRKFEKSKNIAIIVGTIFLAFVTYCILVTVMFSIGFGSWTTEIILYRQKDNSDITINKQIFDVGALGYGGHRTVQLKPVFKYFQSIKQIDTTTFDKKGWVYVNEEIDSHD